MRQGIKSDRIERRNVKMGRLSHFKRRMFNRLTDGRTDGHYLPRKREHLKIPLFAVKVRENQSEFTHHLFPVQLTPTKVVKVMSKGGKIHSTHRGKKGNQLHTNCRRESQVNFLLILIHTSLSRLPTKSIHYIHQCAPIHTSHAQ